MMWRRNPRKRITGALICLTGLFIMSSSVLAAEPHEDPARANPVFSGISLLMYYSGSLDFVLRKDPAEVEARLEKMPFANIPQSLEEATDSFAAASIGISHLVVAIDEDLVKLRSLMEQFRLDEVTKLIAQTFDRLSQANSELKRIQQATETTGQQSKVPSAPQGSGLRRSYDEVVDRIDRIREMLALYRDLLAGLLLGTNKVEDVLETTDITVEELSKATDITVEELSKATDITIEELLKATDITLEIEPMVAFVGDSIRFEGVLTSKKEPLAGREVDILLNNSRYVTVETDPDGHYQGSLQVPYWYIPELDLQALYYPRDKDVGVYLASLSPVIKLKVLFYEAGLEVTAEDRAYPGRETILTGRFDYGQSPPPEERKIEIYFDDTLITEIMAREAFTQEIQIDPQVDVGEHIITVSSAATGKYSSVVTSAVLIVIRATPILDLNIPTLAVIPGSVGLEGRLYSEVGPLSEASIRIGLGKSQIELVSSEDGAFDTKIGVGMGLGAIGSQDLVILALPQEPWHAPLATTRSLMMVNMINCGGILAILIFLGIYLPIRSKERLGAYPRRRVRPEVAISWPELAPAYSDSVIVPASARESREDRGKPRNRVFYWYRLVVRLILGITKALLKPQQTLREFARESASVLGPAAKYFVELTKMVERLLYSQYRPTAKDAENSKRLSHKIEEETELRVTTQPLLARQLRGEGTEAQFEPNEISVVGGAKAVEFGGRVSTTRPGRQLSSWLWVLLMLAVVYYVCILLFVLPLLVASLALCLPMVVVDDSSERGTNPITKGNRRVRVSSILLAVVVLVLVISLLCIWFYPSVQDFMASNKMWNGIRNFCSEFTADNIDSLDDLPVLPDKATLVTIPYLEYSDEELVKMRQFVDDGGTLLLMDDYGYGNSVLAYLGVGVRFTNEVLLDPLFCYKNQWMPRITDFAPKVKESGIDIITLNHATTITDTTESEAIAWSSSTSFLDINENESWDEGEPKGPFPIAVECRFGKGTLALASDPSIMINSMVGRDDNYSFIRYLTDDKGEQEEILVDYSHLTKTPLDVSRTRLIGAREALSSPYALVGITVIVFALVSGYTLKREEIIG